MSNIFFGNCFHSLEIENNYVDFCDEIEIIASTIYHSNDKFQKLLSLQQQVFQNFKQSLFQTGLFLEFSVRPKVPVFRCQKMAFGVPRQKNRDHFLMSTSPQNGGEHVCFMRLALLGGF